MSFRPSFRMTVSGAAIVAAVAACTPVDAGESVADPTFLERYSATYRFRLGKPSAVRPTPDGKAVLFLRSGPRSFVRDLFELDLASGEERVLLSADSILHGADEQLTAEERARRERQRQTARGIAFYRLSRDGRRLLTVLSGRLYVLERATGTVRELSGAEGVPIDPWFSPDGTRIACVRNGELHVTDVETGEDRRLTHDAKESVTNGLAEFVAQEEMRRDRGFWWSPDSTRIAYQRTDTSGLERMTIADTVHPEREAHSWPYPRPGRANAVVRLGIVSASGGPTTWIDWDRDRYEYLASVDWSENAPLTILLQNRRQTEAVLLAVAEDATTSELLVERDEAWLDLDQTVPRWLPDGSAFLWRTERRGEPQLELRAPDGTLHHEVTPIGLGLRSLVQYLPDSREIVVVASADPTEAHLYRLPLNPAAGPPRRLTDEPGIHEATFNRPGTVHVRRASTLSGDERWQVFGPGIEERTLRSVAESPGFRPNLELTTVGSKPALHAAVVRPQNFEPSRRYPVIDHVYGGPTSLMVRADPQSYLLDQWIADQGYIVVAIDGRGTPHRGRDWQRAVKHDLIRVPLDDQVRGLELLGKKYRELDLSRTGIYGWSFGGYVSAMAAMRRPDTFRAAVAGAPVVDWSDYDTHYTERYLGLPGDDSAGYDASNVLNYAADLSRPLLLVHGMADDNVYFMHSAKLADALFRAGKRFDFLPLAGFTHMVVDPEVTRSLYGRIMEFFDAHLVAR